MSLWNSIKGALVEDDGAAPAPQPQAPQGAAQAATPQKATSTVSYQPISSVNKDMVEMIRKQTFSRNTALTALIQASDTLADIITDPVIRLKAAQKTAGGGRGAKEFADAVQIHLNDVDGAELQFEQALEGKVKTEVGGLQAQAAAADAQVNNLTAEIQNLTQRIQSAQQQIADASQKRNELQAQASTKEAELRQAEQEFRVAAETVRNELLGHKATILSTLG